MGRGVEGMAKRIQVEFDDHSHTQLAELQSKTGKTMACVIRDALGVYSALRELLSENGPEAKLAIINRARHELQELSIPSLSECHVAVVRSQKLGGSDV